MIDESLDFCQHKEALKKLFLKKVARAGERTRDLLI
jgi:hypothetical protein